MNINLRYDVSSSNLLLPSGIAALKAGRLEAEGFDLRAYSLVNF